ncbi:MAG: hypothetical protein ABJE66_26280 [Deltaproteobacteria bacterium]
MRLAMPPGETAYSFANVTEVAATRAPRPTIVALARFSTTAPTNIGTTTPPGQTDGEVLDVEARGSAWVITGLDDNYTIPRASEPPKATRWYAIDHGVMSVDHAGGRIAIARFDGGKPTATWTQTLSDPTARDARIAAWLSDAALLTIEHPTDTQLVRVQLLDGKTHPVASLPATEVVIAPSERAGLFAAVFNEHAECALCPRVETRSLADGRVANSFKLPVDVEPFPPEPGRGTAAVGFDGRQVWFFTYFGPHQSDVLGTSSDQKCSYDVFDAATGARLRTLVNATGAWASLSRGCRTHALIPISDGGGIAIAIDDGAHATATKFATPP